MTESLPALIDRARGRLVEARTSAEVLEAMALAKAAMHYAKLKKATNEAQADCFRVIKLCEIRMADEIDAAQERGEVATASAHGRGIQSSVQTADTRPATFDELGFDRRRVVEWRGLREAGGEEVVEQVIATALAADRAPTIADVGRAINGHSWQQFTGEVEWYTPLEYIDAARAVMGGIDLDPASSDEAQAVIKAGAHYTARDDGLSQEWHGRIWLNPPYAQPLIAQFATKMVEEYVSGHVSAAIMLTHNSTDTAWFHEIAPVSTAMCFTKGRVRFVNAAGEVAAPTQGQVFTYFGDDREKFEEVFSNFGFVM